MTSRSIGPKYTSIDNRFYTALFRYLSGQSMEVYSYLCCYARNRDGFGENENDPKIATLMEQSGIGNKAVTRALAQLEHYGFIIRRRTQTGNTYRFPSFDEVEERCLAAIADEEKDDPFVTNGHFPSVERTFPEWQKNIPERSIGSDGHVERTDASYTEDFKDIKDQQNAPVGAVIVSMPLPDDQTAAPGSTPASGDAPTVATGARKSSVRPLTGAPTHWTRRPPERGEEGICSTAPARAVREVPTAEALPSPRPPRTPRPFDPYIDAWCAAMGTEARTVPGSVMARLVRSFKEMQSVGVAAGEVGDLVAYHRRAQEFFWRNGRRPTVEQIVAAIPDWRATANEPSVSKGEPGNVPLPEYGGMTAREYFDGLLIPD